MAVGRPIISTKHGGFTDTDWYDDYGYLVEYDNTSEMEDALKKIYINYSEYQLEKISELCLSTCSEEKVMRKIEKRLSDVCLKSQ